MEFKLSPNVFYLSVRYQNKTLEVATSLVESFPAHEQFNKNA